MKQVTGQQLANNPFVGLVNLAMILGHPNKTDATGSFLLNFTIFLKKPAFEFAGLNKVNLRRKVVWGYIDGIIRFCLRLLAIIVMRYLSISLGIDHNQDKPDNQPISNLFEHIRLKYDWAKLIRDNSECTSAEGNLTNY